METRHYGVVAAHVCLGLADLTARIGGYQGETSGAVFRFNADAIAVAIEPPPPILIAGKDLLTIRHAAAGAMVAARNTDGG